MIPSRISDTLFTPMKECRDYLKIHRACQGQQHSYQAFSFSLFFLLFLKNSRDFSPLLSWNRRATGLDYSRQDIHPNNMIMERDIFEVWISARVKRTTIKGMARIAAADSFKSGSSNNNNNTERARVVLVPIPKQDSDFVICLA